MSDELRNTHPRRMNRLTHRFAGGLTVLLCTGALLFAVRHGLGISPDSTLYLRCARALVAGHGMAVMGPSGEVTPVTAVPPGYPLALAAGARSGLGEFRSAGLINGALFAVTLWFSLRIIESVIGRRALSVWGAAMLGTSVSLLNNYSMMWSEPLFFASLTVGVAALLEAIDGHGWVWLAITSLAFSAACFTRYAGIGIVYLASQHQG